MGVPVLAAAALFAAAAASDTAPRPGPWPPRGYACVRATMPLTIDGRLDDAAWAAAPWTDAFVDIEGDRRPAPRFATRAKMLWDDTHFYVAASMDEPHLWATLTERDAIIFHDNDFEVFLDPDGDSHAYTEIELNALNTVWDLLLVKPYRNGGPALHGFDLPGLVTAVRLDGTLDDPSDTDHGWSVEIAIPFAALDETTEAACPPRFGDRWRVNFSRVEWRLDPAPGTPAGYAKTIDPATGKRYAEDNWVWSPQREIAMHEPEHWGIVEFRESDAATPVEPRPANAAEWRLRYASYALAARREAEGRYPDSFRLPRMLPGAPPLPDPTGPHPIAYSSDGARYVLSQRVGDHVARLTEDGRFTFLLTGD